MRYFIQPSAAPSGDWDDPLVPPISVVEHCPVDTGLVDKGGRTIWRAPEPMGFHARRA